MDKLYNEKNFSKQILQNFSKLSDYKDKYIDDNQNSIIALLKGPDTQYKKILMQDNEVPIVNNQCRDKNSFLQIHVRALNPKEQKRLLKKQYRQLSKQYRRSIKDKCLHFTFPITYPCFKKSKRNQRSMISTSSQSLSSSQHSNNINRLKSIVSISFIDDKNDDMLINKKSKENHPSSSSLLNTPSKNSFTNKIHSSNACIQKHLCQLCGSILSNGICSCIVQYLRQLNNTKNDNILVQFNEIFENLTSNNIIT